MGESKTIAVFTGAVGSVVAAVAIAWAGIGQTTPVAVTIDGPTLTVVETPIRLTGHVNGEFESAYWTDEVGQQAWMSGADDTLDWYCLGVGTFTVSLIAVTEDGSQQQARHEVECL